MAGDPGEEVAEISGGMKKSDVEIVRDAGAISRIFERLAGRRGTLSVVQNGRRGSTSVDAVSTSQLLLFRRNKAIPFRTDAVDFFFRGVSGRNIVGKSRILRVTDDHLEVAFPAQVVIIQRRQAYRVVPTVDSVAIFQTARRWLLSGRIVDLSLTGALVRIPKAISLVVPCDIAGLSLHLNHLLPAGRVTSSAEEIEHTVITVKAASIVRKADNGRTKMVAYAIHFSPTIEEERQLAKIILNFERAAILKGIGA